MKFEVAVIPVSDVDRARDFYRGPGWRLDAGFSPGPDFRVVQLTPPRSACAIIFGTGVTTVVPGPTQGLGKVTTRLPGRPTSALAAFDSVAGLADALRRAKTAHAYAHALTHGYQPAMIVMGGLCAAAALVTALLVSEKRTSGHRIVPRAPDAGCAGPIRTQEVTS